MAAPHEPPKLEAKSPPAEPQKKSREDFNFDRIIGEGSYSTVSSCALGKGSCKWKMPHHPLLVACSMRYHVVMYVFACSFLQVILATDKSSKKQYACKKTSSCLLAQNMFTSL